MEDKVFSIPDGLAHLTKGYLSYAKYTIVDRALVGIDGFKPSQRRILYTMKDMKCTHLTKSANVVGQTMKLHPHGDSSIYGALVRLTDSSEEMGVPFVKGKGNFGKVYSGDPVAEQRYTEVALAPIADELFSGVGGMETKPSYDGSLEEPVLLPVSFPNILCNVSTGIAVGVASSIPSFNFNDVVEYTRKRIKGEKTEPMTPDFSSAGCIYISDEVKEKIDSEGSGSFELTGRYHIEGKTLVITELPYYTDSKILIKGLRAIDGVREVRDESDRKGLRVVVVPSRGVSVELLLNSIISDTSYQVVESANMYLIVKGKPVKLGVSGIVDEWISYREGVLKKQFTLDLEVVRSKIAAYSVLVKLLGDKVLLEGFIEAVKSGKGNLYLKEHFEGVEDSTCTWILGMPLKSFYNPKDNTSTLEKFKSTEKTLESWLGDIKGYIFDELGNLAAEYGSSFGRRTEILNYSLAVRKESRDYVTKRESVEKGIPFKIYTNGTMIKRERGYYTEAGGFDVKSDDILVMLGSDDGVYKVAVNDIPVGMWTHVGKVLDLGVDFESVVLGVVEDKRVAYLRVDGTASTVDYSEWVDAQRIRTQIKDGVKNVSDIGWEFDLSEVEALGIRDDRDIPMDMDCFILATGSNGGVGIASLGFKVKNRTASTRVFTMPEGVCITGAYLISWAELQTFGVFSNAHYANIARMSKKDNVDIDALNEWIRNKEEM